ncbi:plastocyanin/azurin family copper-binding protein [Halospeciosus flavus]|uniref:plastocyanin/azurin family copper-binding protein n=1 Tax=Halospeciosus flavus TaxID=3032283 RepID=UPI003614407F
MNRRDFLRAATGGAGVAGATGAAQASGSSAVASVAANNTTTAGNETGNQTSNQTTTSDGGDLPGSGKTVTVPLVSDPYKFEGATDSPLYIQPGTTVKFVWESDNHNINVDKQPEGASWKGVPEIHNTGYTHSHTFTTKGRYHFWCDPHKSLGMIGDIVVNESGQPPAVVGVPRRSVRTRWACPSRHSTSGWRRSSRCSWRSSSRSSR